MYKIIEINSLIQLDKYKDEWTNLLHTEKISLFQSFTWTRTWIKHFSKGKKTRVYLIFSDNKIRCVIPVFVHRSTYLTLPARVMRLIGYPESDYNDIILEHTGKDILSFCVDNVFSSRLKWDVLQFDEIPETSATGNLLVNAFRDKGYRVLHYRTSTCCYIPVEGDYDNYLKSLSSKMRTNLRTSQKKLRQVGQVTFFRYHGNLADWNRSLEQAFVLETKSWKGRKNLGILYDQSHRQFHKDLLTSLTKGDIAEFTFMTVNDKPISFLYGFKWNHQFLFYNTSFDPAYSRFSPGTAIIQHLVESCFKDNDCKAFDFMRGSEQYKFKLSNHRRYNTRVLVYNKSLYSGLLYFAEKNKDKLKKIRQKIQKYNRSE